MPDVVLITRMDYGLKDGTILKLKPGDSLTVAKESGEKDGKPVFSEDQLREYVAGGVALDKSGELNGWLPPGLDVETLMRDQMLMENGYPVWVDTANPMDQQIPQPQPMSEQHKNVVAQVEARKEATKPSNTTTEVKK